MSKKKENKNVINNWNFAGMFGENPARFMIQLLKWVIIWSVVSSIVGMSSSKLSENKDVYSICMDGCQSDLKISKLSYDFVNPPNEHMTNIAINRVGCLEECNGMYLKLRGK